MSDIAYREHDNRAPALVLAAALHVGVFALVMMAPKGPPLMPIGSSVPINIVSSEPVTDTRPAVEAPQEQTALAPAPVPKAPPQAPAPQVAPPAFSAAAKPKPQAVKPVPEQPSLHPSRPSAASPDLLSHLDSIIHNAQRNSGAANSSAQRGPARPETATQVRPNAGLGYSQSDMLGLEQLLERLWNPNCDVPGGEAVRLTTKFAIGADGHLSDGPHVSGLVGAEGGVLAAAQRRAVDAVHEAEPYAQAFRGQTIVVNFDAKEACAKR